ncbi:hypothetical protein IFM89_003495 [Coptis chinensis]|uniref:Protein kinase domain-containing protein n=1 Tax=Coptis chinensis TaxID=261450 RepID=A0A835HF88_9MAGN|nr:hypothetical protein IFM89_003495 [Coptis chinensis]
MSGNNEGSLNLFSKYTIIRKIGEGTFGHVFLACDNRHGESVAIKFLKDRCRLWEDCKEKRELKALVALDHPNIVKLKDIVQEGEYLDLVFEYMDRSLHQLICERTRFFSEENIRGYCFQILKGIDHMHSHGYFHRDLKPDNILVSGNVVKIADLGSSREFLSVEDDLGCTREFLFDQPYTNHITTLWYRAPEVLVKSSKYGAAIDIWAMGAIMAELFLLQPLFRGTDEVDQLDKICSIKGSPFSWFKGLQEAEAHNIQLPVCLGIPLQKLIPSASRDAIALMESLLSWDPNVRPTAAAALRHPFFTPCFDAEQLLDLELRLTTAMTFPSMNGEVNRVLL